MAYQVTKLIKEIWREKLINMLPDSEMAAEWKDRGGIRNAIDEMRISGSYPDYKFQTYRHFQDGECLCIVKRMSVEEVTC